MGVILSALLARLFGKKEIKILMLGLDGVGKTSILYKLVLGQTVETIPTIGFNVERLDCNNVSLIVWEVNGYLTSHWKHFYCVCQGLIFVVDSNDRDQVSEAKHQLQNLAEADELRDVVVLILANKQDIPDAMSTAELTEKMELNHILSNHRWHIQPASVIQGTGLSEGFKWLSDELNRE